MQNKVDEVKLLLNVCQFDELAITETYFDKKIDNTQLEIENCKIFWQDRSTGQVGRGCLIYISTNICSTHLRSLEISTVERITSGKSLFILGNIYRTPSDSSFFYKLSASTRDKKLW